MDAVHDGMYAKAKRNLDENIYDAFTLEEAKRLQQEHGGFIRTMWCGDEACEIRMKEEAGMTSRCIPFAQQHLADTCAICGKPAKKMIYWGVAFELLKSPKDFFNNGSQSAARTNRPSKTGDSHTGG